VLLLQDSPPGVWLQLLMRCAAEPSCPTALRSLAEQLTEQMSLTAQQQQQIADLREQLSAQQQSAAEQLTCLQQQLSAQQRVAAQQGVQIATLQAQLQQLLQRQQQ
jgi:flagellar capping protein FliD